MAIKLIDEAQTAGARQSKACAVIGMTCRTLRRWRQTLHTRGELMDQRKQAAEARTYPQALTEEEREAVLDACNRPEYQSLPPSQIVPILADRGEYLASESTFYRILHDAEQAAHRGRAQAPREVAKPRALQANAPNQVWSWDITYLPTRIKGDFLRLYLILDIYSRMIVAWEIHREETAAHAAELIRKACLKQGIQQNQLVLHSDNGSPMKGATMLATLQGLGVAPSFSRPSVSDDNPYSESLFRTAKYCPSYPNKPFAGLDQARAWVWQFTQWYNNEHRHSGIKFVTPAQRHAQTDLTLLNQRSVVYEAAKAANPLRWRNRTVRNWTPITSVWLNPPKEHQPPSEMKLAA